MENVNNGDDWLNFPAMGTGATANDMNDNGTFNDS